MKKRAVEQVRLFGQLVNDLRVKDDLVFEGASKAFALFTLCQAPDGLPRSVRLQSAALDDYCSALRRINVHLFKMVASEFDNASCPLGRR